MRLLIDLDGTATDLHRPWLQEFAWATGCGVNYERCDRWDWYSDLPAQDQRKLFSLLTPKLYRQLNPMPWMRESLAQLVTEGHEVVVVTAREAPFHAVTLEWVADQMPFVKKGDVVFTARKDLVCGNLLIDDKAEYGEGPLMAALLLFDQPWNRWSSKPRFRYWDALPAIVRSLV